MLLGGDESGRTQDGNNNAWCQDNEISWLDWHEAQDASELREFVRRLIELRHRHPVLRRESFLRGAPVNGSGLPDVWWFRADGRKMTGRDWQGERHVLGMFLNGNEIPALGPHGEPIEDDSFLLLFNGHEEECEFLLPPKRFGGRWEFELSTAEPVAQAGSARYEARSRVLVFPRSILILKRVT